MSKYEKARERIKEEHAFLDEQELLHKKYDAPEYVVIKEKDNMVKFMIRLFTGFLKIIFTVIIIALATTGILTLIYLRPELMNVLDDIFGEVISLSQ